MTFFSFYCYKFKLKINSKLYEIIVDIDENLPLCKSV